MDALCDLIRESFNDILVVHSHMRLEIRRQLFLIRIDDISWDYFGS